MHHSFSAQRFINDYKRYIISIFPRIINAAVIIIIMNNRQFLTFLRQKTQSIQTQDLCAIIIIIIIIMEIVHKVQ